jgi:hypothetical protein
MFVPLTMVLDFLAPSKAMKAATFSPSMIDLHVTVLTKHEANSAARSIQWTKI